MARWNGTFGGSKRADGGVSAGARPHSELSVVSLVRDMEVDGRTFPAGARGTVVAAYADGKGYEVEFFEPTHGLVTVEAEDLAG